MSFFSTLENDFHAIAAKLLTPAVTNAISGQISMVNITAPPSTSGAAKQGLVAEAIAEAFQIGEALAHALVKLVFDAVYKQTPTVLQPLLTAAQTTANSVVDTQGAALQQKAEAKAATLVASPFTSAPVAIPGITAPIAAPAQPVIIRPVAPVGEPAAGGSATVSGP